MSREREIRRRALADEKRETRRQLEAALGTEAAQRAVIPDHIMPTRSRDPRRLFARIFLERIRRDPHRITFIEHDARMIELSCSCGYVEACPFGQAQADRAAEAHWGMFHVIPDPVGARYRA